jgi:hypothetical protein
VRVFLLSPAYGGGKRARILLEPKSAFATAQMLAAGHLTLGAAFTFMSGLYFRGKLAYGVAFGDSYVITPTRGLLPPQTIVTARMLREFAAVDIDAGERRYRAPLQRDAQIIAERMSAGDQVVLLGSIASTKYVEVLEAAFGPTLHFPPSFIGRGDMSRGGLLLRSARAGVELEYAPLTLATRRTGTRPPKLPRLNYPIGASESGSLTRPRPLGGGPNPTDGLPG